MDLIAKIKGIVDLEQYISIHTELKKAGKDIKGLCPFPDHNEDTPSFVVYPDQHFKCFGCDRRGDVIDFVRYMNGLDEGKDGISQAIDILCREFNIERESRPGAPVGPIDDPTLARKLVTDLMHTALLKNDEALKYLYARQVLNEDIAYWRIGLSYPMLAVDAAKQIDIPTLVKIGLIKSDESLYIAPGLLSFPMVDDRGRIQYWHLKDPAKIKMYQLTNEQRGDSLFFNQSIVKSATILWIVEGPWEVIQLHKLGECAIALCGKPSQAQIKYLKGLRTKAFNKDIRDAGRLMIKIWMDRDENLSGQKASEKLLSELCAFIKTAEVMCPVIGQDPDDYMRSGGKLDALDVNVVPQRYLRIEHNDQGYIINRKDDASLITDFHLNTKYHYMLPESGGKTKRIRHLTISGPGKPPNVAPISGDQLSSLPKFKSWLYDVDNYWIGCSPKEFDELVQCVFHSDISPRVLLSRYYGNVKDDLWLFENGAIDGGRIIPADADGIVWINNHGIQGVKPTDDGSFEDIKSEEQIRLSIPDVDKILPLQEIVRQFLGFYPPAMVRAALGFATACVYRRRIMTHYRAFPMMAMVGGTNKGKTAWVRCIQSLMGLGAGQGDSCSSTNKAWMRHLVRYKSMPLHLSEYTERFRDTMKNIFDGIVYAQARKTTGFETTNPGCNGAAIFTCEVTPQGQSLLNRCVITDFSKFTYWREEHEYNLFHGDMIGGASMGFLVEVISAHIEGLVMDNIQAISRKLAEAGVCRSETGRLKWTYSVIYGAFCALYEAIDLESVFMEVEENPITLDTILSEIEGLVSHSHAIIGIQDPLRNFMTLAQSLYVQDDAKGLADIRDVDGERCLFTNLSALFPLVQSLDNRSGHVLDGMSIRDVQLGLREKFGVRPRSSTDNGKTRSMYSIPLDALGDEYGLTFDSVGEILVRPEESDDPEEETDLEKPPF
jgi:hypothetical protein